MSRVSPSLAVLLLASGVAAQNVIKVPQDQLTIQAAVDAAGNGDQILISAGTYAEAVTLTDKTALNLTGKGKVVIAPPAGSGFVLSGCAQVFMQGLRVQDAAESGFEFLDCEGCVLFKCSVDGTGGDGIRYEGGFNFQVSKVTVTGAGGDGISVAGGSKNFTDGVIIAQTKIIEPAGDGVVANGNGVTVDLCTVTRPGGSGFRVDDTTPSTLITFKDSKVIKPGSVGIQLRGTSARADNVKVIQAAEDAVQVLETAGNCTVENCKLVKPGGNGLSSDADVTGMHISANKVSKPALDGYLVNGAAPDVQDNKVSGATGRGFAIDSEDGSFTGNKATGSKGDGFFLDGLGNTLSGNTAKGSKGFDLHEVTPDANDVDETNSFKTTSP